jgi:N-hydroxyarylamine O-acetyltransferase
MTDLDVAGYLRRLGIAEPGPPSVEALHALHAAHVERVAYEALEIQLGRPTSVDPYESAERIVHRHRGGYCYHLNGAFSLLLGALGYDVRWHRAGVQTTSTSPAGAGAANHLALTVHGLPADESPSGAWFVDVGLGDAMYQPLPLREGSYPQAPFSFALRPSDAEPGGWRFEHDPRGAFFAMDFRPGRATVDDFTERHAYLSTSPDSGFVRTCAVIRRDAHGVDALTGCVLRRLDDGTGTTRTLNTATEWFDALADVFGLPLFDVPAGEREMLWSRVRSGHEHWLSTRAP